MKILLADDHALIRSGLRHELRQLDDVVEFFEAWDDATLREALDRHADVDLALVDLGMPGMSGAVSIVSLRQRYPAIPLIVLSAADAAPTAQDVLSAGAAGFIPKAAMAGVMLQAIRLVLAGGRYVPPELLGTVDATRTAARAATAEPARSLAPGKRPRLDLLSPRQRQVFELLAKGLSNKMIARELDVTEGTVKSHVATIFDVLNVHNRVSAIVEALRLAVPPADPRPEWP
jgi:DNA-binding NarL/FixJ family response regulator